MLHFLSSLFSRSSTGGDALDPAVIEAATERAVDGTDQRLRGFGNYRKRLRPAVETAAVYIVNLIDALPETAELSRRAFSTDPRLRALFVSADHMQEVIGGSKAISDYLRGLNGPVPDQIYGILAMEWEEKTVLGMELRNGIVQRDVPQVTVNFFHHRYLGPTASDSDTRREGKIRAYDYLIKIALERIVSARSDRADLEQQHRLLKRKLDAMKAGNWGLEPMLADSEIEHPDLPALEGEIEGIERELREANTRPHTLEQNFDHISETLGQPEKWLSRRDITLNLDRMLIKTETSSSAASRQMQLTELFSSTGERRIVLPGRFPRQELPEQPDFLEEARRYLR